MPNTHTNEDKPVRATTVHGEVLSASVDVFILDKAAPPRVGYYDYNLERWFFYDEEEYNNWAFVWIYVPSEMVEKLKTL